MSKYETHFEAVKNNQEKAVTYREQIKRYNIALKNEFYIEAGMIAYAMLEDRLKAFLYYIGAIRTIEADKLNVDKTKKTLKNIYFGSEEAARNKRLDINKISIKQSIIRKTLAWTENCIGTHLYPLYLHTLFSKQQDIDFLGFRYSSLSMQVFF